MFRFLTRLAPPAVAGTGKKLPFAVRTARVARPIPTRRGSANEGKSATDDAKTEKPGASRDIEDVFAVNKVILEPNTIPAATTDAGWSWVPPASNKTATQTIVKSTLPILKGIPLTPEEVSAYLEGNGAENVRILELKQAICGTATHLVFASVSSPRLIRKLLEVIVDNLRQRELHHVWGSKGISGGKTEDWQMIDCDTFFIHAMLPDTRKWLDLETYWERGNFPVLDLSLSDRDLDKQMDRLLSEHPLPDEYLERVMGADAKTEPMRVKVL